MEHFLAARPSVTKWGVTAAAPGLGFVPLSAAGFASAAPSAAPGDAASPAAPAPVAAGHRHDARVEVVRDGDVVRGIVVVCLCGERIELDCLY